MKLLKTLVDKPWVRGLAFVAVVMLAVGMFKPGNISVNMAQLFSVSGILISGGYGIVAEYLLSKVVFKKQQYSWVYLFKRFITFVVISVAFLLFAVMSTFGGLFT